MRLRGAVGNQERREEEPEPQGQVKARPRGDPAGLGANVEIGVVGGRSHFCIRSFIHSLIQQKFIEGEARTRRFSLRSQVVTSEGVWPSG